MQRLSTFCRTFWHESEGVTAIEYALLASLIAIAILSAVIALGDAVLTLWTKISTCVQTPSSCPP